MSERNESFWMKYINCCVRDKLCPSKYLIKHIRGRELCCPVEAVRREHWRHLLDALSTDNNLSKVHFASCIWPHSQEDHTKRNKRDKPFPTPYGRTEANIRDICVSLAGLLRSSQTLVILKLENLSLKILDVEQISIGLAESCYVKLLSLAGCKFEPGAVKVLCNGLITSCVTWLDLSCCALTLVDIESICDLIKCHAVKRTNEMFPDTLRYNFPRFEEFHGLNRISLNNNNIEDEGVFFLVDSMADDHFIKAIDLQNCGIENEAALGLLSLATTNQSIEVIDLRLNKIDESILQRIVQQLALNKAGKTYTHEYTPMWRPSEMITNYNDIGRGKLSRKSVYKFRFVKSTSSTSKSPSAYRFPPVFHGKHNSMKDASVQTALDDFIQIPEKVETFMEDLRRRYNNEMKLRKFFMSKYKMLKEENLQLRSFLRGESDNIYIDQETYFDIKHTFEKLKIFFDVMKKYGLWEYISMLGFDETTDVMIKESDTHKSVKMTRKDSPVFAEDVQDCKLREEPCCNCRKVDSKHGHAESPGGMPKETQTASTKGQCNSSRMAKIEEILNEKIAYKLLQEVMNDYNNVSSQQVHSTKPVPGKKTNVSNVSQDTAKPSSSKQSCTAAPSASAGAHMLIKKFSYSNMPKKFKELVTPADFYDIVKRELERCESATVGKPMTSHSESSSQTPLQPAQIKVRTEISMPNDDKIYASRKQIDEIIKTRMFKENLSKQPNEPVIDDDWTIDENLTIAELIARRKKNSQKCVKTKKDDLDGPIASKEETSKSQKIPIMPKLNKTVLPKSRLKHSSSSQTSYEDVERYRLTTPVNEQVVHNVSSDEINSSDSVVTASDKFSSSSASSSSSSKSNVKSVSSLLVIQKESKKLVKSYLESVSDASTFKDVESILETEVVSQVESEKSEKLKDKNVSVVKTLNSKSNSSSTSTVRNEPKSENKPVESVSSENSVKNASSKKNKSSKSASASQAKTKSVSKQSSKSRPKSNSSKSSSVPSLSDITTVTSESLNTDSVMKKISVSEDNSKGGN